MYSNKAQEYSVPDTRLTSNSPLQGNAYGTRSFRKPVAWLKVVSTDITEQV